MRITTSNGSKARGFSGCRVRFYSSENQLIEQIEVPAGNAKRFIKTKAGAKYRQAIEKAVIFTARIDGLIAASKHKNKRCAELAQLFATAKARIQATRTLERMSKPAWERQI